MPIRPSAGGEVRQLIEALGGRDEVRRESAIARLTVIGGRALDHLLQEYANAGITARVAILRVLESLGDPRGFAVARAALDDRSADVAAAAIASMKGFLKAARGNVARDALDALVARATDTTEPPPVRLAAIDALREAPMDVQDAVFATLGRDPDSAVRARARRTPAGDAESSEAIWTDMIEGRLPAQPDAARRVLMSRRAAARLTELQRLVDSVRAREQQETDAHLREEWRALRGAVHQALAGRGSRLALYDLRDSLLEPERLPVGFLAAIEEIGDATCLEPLAAAYEASSRSGDAWWREHVATAFRAIVHREGLTRRHAAVKRTMARWPDATADLLAR